MKTLSILIVAFTLLSFSMKGQTTEKQQKEQEVKEIMQLRKVDVATKANPQVKTETKVTDHRPTISSKSVENTTPVRKAVSVNGVQAQTIQTKKVTQSKDIHQQKSKKVEREVPQKGNPDNR